MHRFRCAGLAAAGLVSLCLGCDTGEYAARRAVTEARLSERAKVFQFIYATPTELQDSARQATGVRLHLPTLFGSNTASLAPGVAGADGQPVEADRYQPPGGELPGLSYAMEAPVDEPTGKVVVVYAYFAFVPAASKPFDQLLTELQQQFGKGASWQEIRLPTGEGGQSPPLRRLTVMGQQPFNLKAANGAVETLDGRLDLFALPAGANYALIGWRTTAAAAAKHNFIPAIEAAMSTIQAPPAEAPMPMPPAS